MNRWLVRSLAGLCVVLAAVLVGPTAQAAEYVTTVAAANTVTDSWWGAGAYTDCSAPKTAGASGDVTVRVPVFRDSGGATVSSADTEIELFPAAGFHGPTDAYGGAPVAGQVWTSESSGPKTATLTAGTDYVVCATHYAPGGFEGYTVSAGDLVDQITASGPPPPTVTVTASPSAAPGENSGVWIEPSTGAVKVDQDTFVALGIVLWLGSVCAGLITARLVLP